MAGRLRTCAVLVAVLVGSAGCARTAGAAPTPSPSPSASMSEVPPATPGPAPSVLRSRPLMTAIPPIVRSALPAPS